MIVTTEQIPNSERRQESAVSTERCHLLTVNVEDYFQVGAFQQFIRAENWYRFESRLKVNVEQVLSLLEAHRTKATFFVLGWTAEKDPQLIRSITAAGHEVASRGFLHQPVLSLTRDKLCEDLHRAKCVLEDVTGEPVDGFRLSDGWLDRKHLWLLDEIAAAGYRYDSSLMPQRREFAAEPEWRGIRKIDTSHGPLLEVSLSTLPFAGGWLPIAGGNYQRQIPDFLMRRLVDRCIQTQAGPFVMYFHPWEFDSSQPRLSVADRLTTLRHYRKLGKYQRILPQYLDRYKFTSIREHASLAGSPLASLTRDAWQVGAAVTRPRITGIKSAEFSSPGQASVRTSRSNVVGKHRTSVTLVIPCYNEETSLVYLANTLTSVTSALSDRYDTKVLFVDDCSRDATVEVLEKLFGGDSSISIVRHAENKGVSAAILTGLRHATTDIVCSMDCDCSYDPHELRNMLPLLTEKVAMVTASPYHRSGHVRNVPGWRLVLSRGLSALYQRLLKHDLATWTSCFRVYRRDQILDLPLQENGFLGTAELAAHLTLNDRVVAEYPTTLEVRLFGLSKMKTIRAIFSHLRLLIRIAGVRFSGKKTATSDAVTSTSNERAHS